MGTVLVSRVPKCEFGSNGALGCRHDARYEWKGKRLCASHTGFSVLESEKVMGRVRLLVRK